MPAGPVPAPGRRGPSRSGRRLGQHRLRPPPPRRPGRGRRAATGRPLPSTATWATPAARAASSSTSATARTQRATPRRHKAAGDGRWPSWRPSATPTPTRPAPGWAGPRRARPEPGTGPSRPAPGRGPDAQGGVAVQRTARRPARRLTPTYASGSMSSAPEGLGGRVEDSDQDRACDCCRSDRQEWSVRGGLDRGQPLLRPGEELSQGLPAVAGEVGILPPGLQLVGVPDCDVVQAFSGPAAQVPVAQTRVLGRRDPEQVSRLQARRRGAAQHRCAGPQGAAQRSGGPLTLNVQGLVAAQNTSSSSAGEPRRQQLETDRHAGTAWALTGWSLR